MGFCAKVEYEAAFNGHAERDVDRGRVDSVDEQFIDKCDRCPMRTRGTSRVGGRVSLAAAGELPTTRSVVSWMRAALRDEALAKSVRS